MAAISPGLEHFLTYLAHHPAFPVEGPGGAMLLGTTVAYDGLGEQLRAALQSRTTAPVHRLTIDRSPASLVLKAMEVAALFVFFYDSFTLPQPQPTGPPFVAPLEKSLKQNWRKSVLVKDHGRHFEAVYSMPPQEIRRLNAALINRARQARSIRFSDDKGSDLTLPLKEGQLWTSVHGFGNRDILPGEIATHGHGLSGQAVLTGTFLSTIPFALKHRHLDLHPLYLSFEEGRLTDWHCDDEDLSRDFARYLALHPGNRVCDEFGIGTNQGVPKLLGLNAAFEERHPGLHLGLGGGAVGTIHLDLLFAEGTLFFDDEPLFRKGRFLV